MTWTKVWAGADAEIKNAGGALNESINMSDFVNSEWTRTLIQ